MLDSGQWPVGRCTSISTLHVKAILWLARSPQTAVSPCHEGATELLGVSPTSRPNTVIAAAYLPMEIALRCQGRAARQWSINGPEVVSVPGHCVLETAEWQVSGLEEGQSTVHLQPPVYVPVPSLNLTWPIKITRKLQKQLSFVDRADVPLADLTDFKELDSALPMNWQVTAPIIGYPLIGIVILVIIVVVAFRM